MSIKSLSVSIADTWQLTKTNSGYPATTQGPSTIGFTGTQGSGQQYATTQVIASGQNLSLDLASGSLTDFVGQTIQMTRLYGVILQPNSGAALLTTDQSGGPAGWMVTGSGGILVPPGGCHKYQEPFQSGAGFPLTGGQGTLKINACSGATLISFGVNGI